MLFGVLLRAATGERAENRDNRRGDGYTNTKFHQNNTQMLAALGCLGQYIVVQIGSSRTDYPGALVAYRLPD